MIEVPELTQELADEITKVAVVQLRTSRTYKMQRMAKIQESENLYFGVVPKTIKNPFNESFPFMSGFVDHLISKLDDPPMIEINHTDEAYLIDAKKHQARINQEIDSTTPNANWAYKDRCCRKMAVFSGLGVYSLFASRYDNVTTFHFDAVDYYDFHCEPNGGGDLETHVFCGEENIFKTREEIMEGMHNDVYDTFQVTKMMALTTPTEYKQTENAYTDRVNRQRGLGMDPLSHNYVGQDMFRLAQWCMVYKGVRWYVLFDPLTAQWIRIKPLREVVGMCKHTCEALYPYIPWQTHEEYRTLWCKSPADDAAPIAKTINRILNQELYNREKQNRGQRAYDPEMYHDVEALADWRPDGLTPFDSKGGTRTAQSGIYQFDTPAMKGSVELVSFLDSYTGQKTGTTPGSQGQAPDDQKVGIYFGEMKQVEERMGLYNKSYKDAWAKIGYRFVTLADMYISPSEEVMITGAKGEQWVKWGKTEKSRIRDFGITIKGGNTDMIIEQQKNQIKMGALANVTTVNQQWLDTQKLRAAGYTDEEIKEAFNQLPSESRELMSEAKQGVDMIARGRMPKLNMNATAGFIQHIIDLADEYDGPGEKKAKMYDYAAAHEQIAKENEVRKIQIMRSQQAQAMATGVAPAPQGGGGSQVQGLPAQQPGAAALV